MTTRLATCAAALSLSGCLFVFPPPDEEQSNGGSPASGGSQQGAGNPGTGGVNVGANTSQGAGPQGGDGAGINGGNGVGGDGGTIATTTTSDATATTTTSGPSTLGMPCSLPGNCDSGQFCTDSVCCLVAACGAECQACGSSGDCEPVPDLTDPHGDCTSFSACGGTCQFGGCATNCDVQNPSQICCSDGSCATAIQFCPPI